MIVTANGSLAIGATGLFHWHPTFPDRERMSVQAVVPFIMVSQLNQCYRVIRLASARYREVPYSSPQAPGVFLH